MTVASPEESRDLGLQAERTALAWRRTGLTAFVLGLLLVRLGLADGAPAEVAAGGAALATSAALGAIGRGAVLRDPHRRRRLLGCCATGMAVLSTATVATVLIG
ncbi:DUF202 domain-containing protein [Nocardioides insulae]|uniref:DUF202 domain-containing protein n=1 Tax=Nocardioides insulae TaxID=394734 RepID=UPI0003F730A7|nr:DUF202 domain-containing protein [Nocardioides insulae]